MDIKTASSLIVQAPGSNVTERDLVLIQRTDRNVAILKGPPGFEELAWLVNSSVLEVSDDGRYIAVAVNNNLSVVSLMPKIEVNFSAVFGGSQFIKFSPKSSVLAVWKNKTAMDKSNLFLYNVESGVLIKVS